MQGPQPASARSAARTLGPSSLHMQTASGRRLWGGARQGKDSKAADPRPCHPVEQAPRPISLWGPLDCRCGRIGLIVEVHRLGVLAGWHDQVHRLNQWPIGIPTPVSGAKQRCRAAPSPYPHRPQGFTPAMHGRAHVWCRSSGSSSRASIASKRRQDFDQRGHGDIKKELVTRGPPR